MVISNPAPNTPSSSQGFRLRQPEAWKRNPHPEVLRNLTPPPLRDFLPVSPAGDDSVYSEEVSGAQHSPKIPGILEPLKNEP